MDRKRGRTLGLGARLIEDLFPATVVEQTRNIGLQGQEVTYLLRRSQKRRRIAFLVDDSGLTVHVPWRAPDFAIDQAILSADRWILKKLAQWEVRPRPRHREWRDGAVLDYMGRQILLSIIDDPVATRVELKPEGVLHVDLHGEHSEAHVRHAVVQWYRRHALRHFHSRIDQYARKMDRPLPRLFLSNATTRWGSCNADGEIRLSWRLMQAHESVIDYVVAHEMAHLVHMNHSQRFWRLVGKLQPGFETARSELSAMTQHYMGL